MTCTRAVLLLAFVFVVTVTPNISHAQNSGYAVTERGANYKVLQKTTIENGTNRVHQYTELATGLNYQNSYGQWTEAQEQISILPQGGAAAVQGQHQVYFPADIYNGVIEVVTPDGRHLKSRPLGVSYDDGRNTVFIATLTNSIGMLTASNQVTYPNAFTDIKADLVCTYRKSGFECDLVFREKPPTPDAYGLDPDTSTLQLVTEFFNTQDPQTIPAAYDEWYGLQDETLKFGRLTMTHGKAFAVGNQKANSTAVYKRWLHIQGRTFLIEELPLVDLADDLSTLPETTNAMTRISNPVSHFQKFASNHRQMPPGHEFVSDTKKIEVASAEMNKRPGVVLDYDEIDSGETDYTFLGGTTYLITDFINFAGTTTFEGGAVIKFYSHAPDGAALYTGAIVCPTDLDTPVILTSSDDNSVGETISGSSGSPSIAGVLYLAVGEDFGPLNNLTFAYAGLFLTGEGDVDLWNCQFLHVPNAIGMDDDSVLPIHLHNVLFADCGSGVSGAYFDSGGQQIITMEQVTADTAYFVAGNQTDDALFLTNCIVLGSLEYFPGTVTTNEVVFNPTGQIFKTAANANYYLTNGSPYRDVGTTEIDSDLLTEIQTMTTYAPQDGGWPDTNTPDLGYHYSVNEDSDYDGIPDWWIWKYFGSYTNSGSDLDSQGNTLLYDYQNGLDPNIVSFTVQMGNQHFNATNATGSFVLLGGTPSYETVVVGTIVGTNLNSALWTAYDGVVHVNLGPTDGVYHVWLGLKGRAIDSQPTWMGTTVYLDRVPPTVTITNPVNTTVTVPYLQLQGFADETLLGVTYDLSNAIAVVTNLSAQMPGVQFFDTNTFEYTTDYFQCYDVLLTNGLNSITVHATDLAGNVTTTNVNVTLDYSAATNPVIQLKWPQDGMEICQGSFTLRGWVDDSTAAMAAQITDTNGDTNIVTGLVERTGVFWVNNLPLNEGTNVVTLWATNAAGLASVTNISVIKSDMTLTLDNISGDLWLPTVNVSGSISDTSAPVWANGVQGTNYGDGTWEVDNVPVSEGGVASFDVTTVPADAPDPSMNTNVDKPDEVITESAAWGESSIFGIADSGQVGSIDTRTGTYSSKAGGSYAIHTTDYDTNGALTEVDDFLITIAPDWSTPVTYSQEETIGGLTGISTNYGGSMTQPNEEGALSYNYGGGWIEHEKHSTVERVYHMGGTGSNGKQVLAAAAASPVEETGTSPYGDVSVDGDILTLGDVGQTVMTGESSWAYKGAAAGSTVRITSSVPVPMQRFTPDGAEYFKSHFEVFVCQPWPHILDPGWTVPLDPDTGSPPFGYPIWVPGINAGHAWWKLSTDAPSDAVNRLISTNNSQWLGQEVGYGPISWGDINWTLVLFSGSFTAPGELPFPNGDSSTTNVTYTIGFDDLKASLNYTENLHEDPVTYNLKSHNCCTTAHTAGVEAGIGMPSDWDPEDFGFSLPP